MSCLFCYVADCGELDMLAKLVEQEVPESQLYVKNTSVECPEPCSRELAELCASKTSSGSVADVGSCSLNFEPVANAEAPVTETDEQC